MKTYQFDISVVVDAEDEDEAMEEAMQRLGRYTYVREGATVTVISEDLDTPTQRVASLSADLRKLVESDDDYVDDAQTMMCATDLLDAIDAMLSEDGR